MKIYYGGGNEDFTMDQFTDHLSENSLLIEPGRITHAKILERKTLSNKGHALDGGIKFRHCSTGLNIGGNPIGTGWKNYTSFLEEMDCKKIGPLYRVESIIGKEVYALMNRSGSNGIFTLKGFSQLN